MSEVLDQLSEQELELLLAKRKAEKDSNNVKERAAYEGMRDTTVKWIMKSAQEMNKGLRAFKELVFNELTALQELSARHDKSRPETWKGSYQLVSNDGGSKIDFIRQVTSGYDETSLEAEALIKGFVERQFEGNEGAAKMVTSLLERRNGQLDVKLVSRLQKMEDDFEDPDWKLALKILRDSYKEMKKKDYVRFWTLNEKGEWDSVILDFAAV